MKHIKVFVVGDWNVGKKSLVTTYTENSIYEYIPSIFDNYSKKNFFQNQEIDLDMWLVAGCDFANKDFRMLAYDKTDVFLICFSIENEQSFENAQNKWIPEIIDDYPSTPFIMVGMKSDLRDNKEREDLISKDVAKNIANEIGARCYIECSSNNFNNVDEVFERVMEIALNPQEKIYETNEKSCCNIY